MNHGRLPWLRPTEMDAEQLRVYNEIVGGKRAQSAIASSMADDDGRLHGPFNPMLFNPAIGGAVQHLGSVVRYDSVLPDRSREIATLIVAVAWKSNHEWSSHTRLGRAAGLTDDEIAALLEDREAPTFDESEHMVWTVTRALISERDLDDAEYEQARDVLGFKALTDLVFLVGYYELLARSLRVWRTPLPDGSPGQFGDARAPHA